MKIPTFKRIYKTDYEADQQPMIERLALTINNGFEVLYNSMVKNISLDDNIACSVKKVTLTVNSDGTPTSSTSFKIDTSGAIKGISVIKADNLTNSKIYVDSTPFISFSQDSTLITLNNVKGLPANNKFELTLIAWA